MVVERERAAARETRTREAGTASAEGGVVRERRVASTRHPTVVEPEASFQLISVPRRARCCDLSLSRQSAPLGISHLNGSDLQGKADQWFIPPGGCDGRPFFTGARQAGSGPVPDGNVIALRPVLPPAHR